MTLRTARCQCGRLELACSGAPAKVALCHCRDCQRRTGSAFGLVAFYPRASVRVAHGADRCFERPSASGSTVLFHFCGTCGSSLFWEPARLPQLIGVAVGAFADPAFPPPDLSAWTKDRLAWVDLPADVARFEASPLPQPPAPATEPKTGH